MRDLKNIPVYVCKGADVLAEQEKTRQRAFIPAKSVKERRQKKNPTQSRKTANVGFVLKITENL